MPTEVREATPWTEAGQEFPIDNFNVWGSHKVMLFAYQEIGGVTYFRDIETDIDNPNPEYCRVLVDKEYPTYIRNSLESLEEVLSGEHGEIPAYVNVLRNNGNILKNGGVIQGIVVTQQKGVDSGVTPEEVLAECIKDDKFTTVASAIVPKADTVIEVEQYGEDIIIETEFLPMSAVYVGTVQHDETAGSNVKKNITIMRSDKQYGLPLYWSIRNPAEGNEEHVIAMAYFEADEQQEELSLFAIMSDIPQGS